MLAIRWGHQVRDQFPDGQLYLHLLGSARARAPVSAADAIRTLLEGLGCRRGGSPLTEAEARRMLERRLGPDRVAAEFGTVGDIIDRCERLPPVPR